MRDQIMQRKLTNKTLHFEEAVKITLITMKTIIETIIPIIIERMKIVKKIAMKIKLIAKMKTTNLMGIIIIIFKMNHLIKIKIILLTIATNLLIIL